ncbi:MAG: acyl-CoA dehydrogenase family protein, partial [Dehalococcoidia bacterium]
EYGGAGADCLTLCIAGEELAVGDLGLAVIFDQTWKFTHILTESASEEQRNRYLPRFMEDDTFLLALGMTEEIGGSDHLLPYNEPGAGARTSAVRARRAGRDGGVINGRKIYIGNGGAAKLHTILARTDPTKGGLEGLTAFLVELGTPGFTVGRIEDKLGNRLEQNAELIFEDCWVPAENLLGGESQAWGSVGGPRWFARSNAEAGATVLGVGRAALEDALAYAKQRVQGGKPIIGHQAIKLMLADMLIQIRAARALIWQAAWMVDHPEHLDPTMGQTAKIFAAEAAVQVSKMGIEIFGGAGIMRDSAAEKHLRDAVVFLHSDGANQILRLRIGNALEVAVTPLFGIG